MSEEFGIVKPPSLAEIAYDRLKRFIMTLELSPGEPIVAEKLAHRLGVSRTPVRDALMRLEADGFIESISNNNMIVSRLTSRRIIGLFQVRKPLECLAIRLAIPNITGDQLDELSVRFQEIGQKIRDKPELHFENDTNFHQLIFTAADNDWLIRILRPLNEHGYRIRRLAAYSFGEHVLAAHKEHCQILEALKKRDVEDAERIMETHLTNTCNRIIRLLEDR
jgi:DNA-binding GntR family transcriptional regulator